MRDSCIDSAAWKLLIYLLQFYHYFMYLFNFYENFSIFAMKNENNKPLAYGTET